MFRVTGLKTLGRVGTHIFFKLFFFSGKIKKVNKQCLLDTPRTVRFSDTWQVIVQTSRPKFGKEDFSRICANKNYNLLHAYVQCVYIVSAKYQIAPSKAVVGVEWPIKALSMHIQKSYKVIIV